MSHMRTPVLFVFDSIISISTEVEVIWSRKWTAMTWLYAFTRYTTVIIVCNSFNPADSSEVCHSYKLLLVKQVTQYCCRGMFLLVYEGDLNASNIVIAARPVYI